MGTGHRPNRRFEDRKRSAQGLNWRRAQAHRRRRRLSGRGFVTLLGCVALVTAAGALAVGLPDLEVEPGVDDVLAVAFVYARKAQRDAARARRLRDAQSRPAGSVLRDVDALHLPQLFELALGLFRLGGLVAEAVDELFEVRDFAVLLRPGCEQGGAALLALVARLWCTVPELFFTAWALLTRSK